MQIEFLSGSVQFVKGVGPRRASALEGAGVRTIRDLFQYYPRRYLDRTSVTRIREIASDMKSVTVVGTIRATGIIPGRKRKRFEVQIEDEWGGRLKCVWFQGVTWISRVFEVGQKVAFHGKPQRYGGGYTIYHPDFDRLDEEGPALETGRIISLYPGSATLEKSGLTSRSLRKILFGLFKEHGENLGDVFPSWLNEKYDLIDGRVALRAVHFPRSRDELERARHRLKFEEFFFIQLMLSKLKKGNEILDGYRFRETGGLVRRFIDDVLPFQLTCSQLRAIQDIEVDTQSGRRMNRLIQGDVGSGKTVVAVIAMLSAADSGFQSVFMAPTEILAEQHYRNLKAYLEPLGIQVRLLVGGMRKAVREEILEGLAGGDISVVVGTHAVIQKGVDFRGLGMCVVDEQHRFGVLQRATLFAKGNRPHMLLMTATPIPRSLALTLYGDLDVSIMRDRPPGRKPVSTVMKWETHRDEVNAFLRTELESARQCYVVFPLVEESEKLDLKDAETGFERLRATFGQFTVDLLHGRMTSDQKEETMRRFEEGEIHLLVSTTVIEVGVDIPNATVMLIEHAERFGLSQLHQLRGRIGRGEHASTCILMAEYPRSPEADTRLRTMVRTDDGFEISEVDLKLRGAGDFFGTRQSGLPDLRIADIVTDTEILITARQAAFELTEMDPDLESEEHRLLACYYDAFYREDRFNLSRIG